MKHTVTADFGTLFNQSKDTACDYFDYARKELAGQNMKYTASDVIALAQIMAYDLRTSSILIASQKLETAIGYISESMEITK